MNGGDDDLETRLRAWRPAEVPWDLNVRLRAADPTRPSARRTRRGGVFWLGTGALAGALIVVLVLTWSRWPVAPAAPSTPVATRSATVRRDTGEPFRRAAFSENLTMNIHTGVRPDFRLVALRLDGDGPVERVSTLFGDGKIALKVDCQF